ncbi:helix-turn-helix transcriptional regulator [Staphylococcus epidermidis]|nr:helix-turn-helix transcriptional regulator [Staphylococcus epidermidis]
MNRIAEVSGATVGSIYQYFPNKEAMIAAVYERLLDQGVQAAVCHARATAGLIAGGAAAAGVCQHDPGGAAAAWPQQRLSCALPLGLHLGLWHAPQSRPAGLHQHHLAAAAAVHGSEVQTDNPAAGRLSDGTGPARDHSQRRARCA